VPRYKATRPQCRLVLSAAMPNTLKPYRTKTMLGFVALYPTYKTLSARVVPRYKCATKLLWEARPRGEKAGFYRCKDAPPTKYSSNLVRTESSEDLEKIIV